MEKRDGLEIILAEEVRSIEPKKIDDAIQKILQETDENYEKIGELTLECSAALSSAQSRSSAMASRGLFKRALDKVTGKDDRLRSAIERDNVAANYAMQQMVSCVLKECRQNRELSLVINQKLNGEIKRLENDQIILDENLNLVRQALIRFYAKHIEDTKDIRQDVYRLYLDRNSHCKCGKEIAQEQVVCPYCGTIQELKMEKLPEEMQRELRELARLMKATPEDLELNITWDKVAKKYAETLKRTAKIAGNAGVLTADSQLARDIEALIHKCKTPEFQIAVVGLMKAGKSMLLNALIGQEEAALVGIPADNTLSIHRAGLHLPQILPGDG